MALTPVPMPTTLSLVPAASSPIALPAPATNPDFPGFAPVTPPPINNPPSGLPNPPIVVAPGTVIPGEPREKQNAGHDYILVLPTFAWLPLVQGVKFNLSAYPPFGTSQAPANNATPPPILTTTRTPPFPAYPS